MAVVCSFLPRPSACSRSAFSHPPDPPTAPPTPHLPPATSSQLQSQCTIMTHNHTPHTTYHTQHATRSTQHAARNTRHTTHNTQHTAHHTSHITQHTPDTQRQTQQATPPHTTAKWLQPAVCFFKCYSKRHQKVSEPLEFFLFQGQFYRYQYH